jgi:MEMO1 family protein
MAGPSGQLVRQPAVAGTFYPADPNECRAQARTFTSVPVEQDPKSRWIGGVVPHAGWICSGAIAGLTMAAIAKASRPDVVVIFGAIHTPARTDESLLDSYSAWQTPDGACEVTEESRRRVLESASLFRVDDGFHQREHAVEVELPLVRSIWPDAAILPIEVPAGDRAVEAGRATAKVIAQSGRKAVFLASSDLTHYGPAYGFVPAGVGTAGLNWALDNDRLLIDRILRMQADTIVPEVRARYSACGAGAIAAMLAACQEMGARQAKLLRHASSYQVLSQLAPQRPDNAVGYASIVVGA